MDNIKSALLKPINPSAISIMGLFSLLWGFWVGNPWWDVFPHASIFRFMTIIMPEWAWGLAAASIGASILFGVIKKSYGVTLHSAQAGFYFWLFASVNFFLGDWENTGGITLLMIAIYCGYVALNLYVNRIVSVVDQENLAFEKEVC